MSATDSYFKPIPKFFRSHFLLFGMCLVSLGLSFRLYNFPQYQFLFDQVQIYENAQNIAGGHLTLIGPRTGPAQMYTGPLIYYLNALVLLVIHSPYTLVVTTTVISAITGFALFYLSKKYLNKTSAIIITLLWATSPFLIQLDRVSWNPNFMILASALIFFPLLKQKLLTIKDFLIISLGVFLGYQAHFSGLLLGPLALAILHIQKRLTLSGFFLIILSYFTSLVPTILFDLRHDWLNLHGLMALLNSTTNFTTHLSLTASFFSTSKLMVQLMGFIWFDLNDASLILLTGTLFVLGFFGLIRSNTSKQISLLWIGSILVLFTLYRQSIPPYYLLILVPVILYMLAQLVEQVWQRSITLNFWKQTQPIKLAFIFSASLIALATLTTFSKQSGSKRESIATSLAIKKYVDTTTQITPIKNLIYDMEEVDSTGYRALLKNVSFVPNGRDYHLIYPFAKDTLTSATFADNSVAVWIDSRTNTTEFNYLSRSDYIIKTPKTFTVLENHYDKPFNSRDYYQIFTGNQPVCNLLVIPNLDYVPDFATHSQPVPADPTAPLTRWGPVQGPENVWYFQHLGRLNILLQPLSNLCGPTEVEFLQ